MNQNWNTEKYSQGFSFVYKYGADVLNLIEPDGVKNVIDLGCGTGALTKALAEKGFNVTGLDASEEMLNQARANNPGINFIHSDAANFKLSEKVDAIFSNAVLHWIDKYKQPLMMKCVYNALRSGGQFVFEMGGYGCCRLIHEELAKNFAAHGYKYVMPFYFPTIGEYASLLENAGFTVRFAILFDRPTKLDTDEGMYNWIKMFVNIPFKSVKESDREIIILDSVNNLRNDIRLYHGGEWFADYVRLRVRAVKE
ncbi:MAG: methyltransferase domain-containing protein [Synergistaceae bacterium]|nr:methyltransferase domain-containing protein [Synergistaceae bacterium]